MIKKQPVKPDLDELVRRAFPDDAPPEVEAELRRDLAAFRREHRGAMDASRAAWPSPGSDWTEGFVIWTLWRTVAAALSITVLALGAHRQVAGRPSESIDAFDLWQTRNRTLASVRAAVSMDVVWSGQVDGVLLRADVHWTTAGWTRLRLEAPDRLIERTVWMAGETPRVVGAPPPAIPSAASASSTDDAKLAPIRPYLAPTRLVALLSGEWRARGSVSGTVDTFLVRPRDSEQDIELLVEGRSGLPERIVVGHSESVELRFAVSSEQSVLQHLVAMRPSAR